MFGRHYIDAVRAWDRRKMKKNHEDGNDRERRDLNRDPLGGIKQQRADNDRERHPHFETDGKGCGL